MAGVGFADLAARRAAFLGLEGNDLSLPGGRCEWQGGPGGSIVNKGGGHSVPPELAVCPRVRGARHIVLAGRAGPAARGADETERQMPNNVLMLAEK
jgi:hypothetical protein